MATGVERGDELDRILGIATPLLRWRYAILAVAAYAFSFQHMRGTGKDWRFFVEGSELIVGQHHSYTSLPGGLHFYANYPTFQIGPLSLIAALPFRVIGPGDGRVLGAIVMTAVAPLLVFVLERTAALVWPAVSERDVALRQATVLLGGVMVVQSWSTLATIYAHLDDVLTLSAIVAALWAVAARRPLLLGLALGAAIAAKPWGVVALPLAFALPGRARWRALTTAGVVACLAWGPFLLADGDTWSAMRPQVLVAPSAVLHLLGVPLGDGPDWTRPVQLGCALLAGGVAVWRRRWGGGTPGRHRHAGRARPAGLRLLHRGTRAGCARVGLVAVAPSRSVVDPVLVRPAERRVCRRLQRRCAGDAPARPDRRPDHRRPRGPRPRHDDVDNVSTCAA